MPFRGALRVERLDDERGALALERLRAGDQIVLLDLGVRLEDVSLHVTTASAWSDVPDADDPRIRAELDEAVRRSRHLLATFRELDDLVSESHVVVELVMDYETSSVLLGSRALPLDN